MAEYKNPVLKKGKHKVTSPFGMRTIWGKKKMHNGIDLVGEGATLDDIIAFADGKVVISKNSLTAGEYVRIDHGNGIFTRYLHMKKGSRTVKVGQAVKKGQVLGFMGATGNVTGAHLHFDISINGKYVDPSPYLEGTKTFTPKKEKSVEEIAKEVIAGKWGNGADRKKRLTAAGYSYAEVQTMVDKLLAKPTATAPKVNYYPRYNGNTVSIVTALKAIKVTSSFSHRKKIAKANGITLYLGTASQNTKLLNLLKQGKLIKP